MVNKNSSVITIGSRRERFPEQSEASDEGRGLLYKIVSAIGMMAVCVCLVLPMAGRGETTVSSDDAIAVMSLDTREKLVRPEISTSAESEMSIFEYIGEFVAGFLERTE